MKISETDHALRLCREVQKLKPASPLSLALADALSSAIFEAERLRYSLQCIVQLEGTDYCTRERHSDNCSVNCPIAIAMKALHPLA